MDTEHTASANRKYKDSVFTLLFSEPERLLELYNALADSDYGRDTKIEINTLEGVLFLNRVNDISFVIDDKIIILAEHQSNVNNNLSLRFLLYFSRVLEKIIDDTAVYRQKLMKIPFPEFIVLYNGTEAFPEETTLRLSDAFMEVPEHAERFGSLDLTVRVVNVNYGHNEDILNKSEHLNGYAVFVARVRENRQNGLELAEAITEAIKYCAEHNILQPFLTQHSSEVLNMLTTEFDLDIAKEVWREEGYEDGREEGREEGEYLKAIAIAKNAIAENLPLAVIVKITGLTREEIEALRDAD